MFNGKNKALTFSYDDGVYQDARLAEIFNRYGLKCTFNLNSALFLKISNNFFSACFFLNDIFDEIVKTVSFFKSIREC